MAGVVKLHRDHDKDVVFFGARLVKVSSRKEDSKRWTEIRIYKSKAGNWIVSEVGRSLWDDEHDRHQVYQCGKRDDDVIKCLRDEAGQLGWLSKDALQKAGIDTTEFIE